MRYISFVILLAVTSLVTAQEPAAKVAVPDDAAQKTASAVVADVYKPDYEKAKTAAQKIELSKKLLGEGTATKDDSVSRFVLFRIARDIAAQQGDLTTAFRAIDVIDTEYEVDILQMKVDAATTAVKVQKVPKDHLACADLLAPLIEKAVAADRYSIAKSLSELTLGCAREGRDSDRIKQMVLKTKEIDEITKEYEKVKEARLALQANLTDPAANYTLGRFLCLFKGDWKTGTRFLSNGNNEEFKAAALLELEAQPDSLKLGNGWWKISESLEGTPKSRAKAHAGEWYRKALPGLSGLTKSKVEKLLADLPQSNSPKGTQTQRNVNLLESLDVKKGTQLGEWSAERKGLLGGSAAASKIDLGKSMTENYDCEFTFAILGRDKSGFGDLIVTLPLVNDSLCIRSVDGKTAVFLFGATDAEVAKKRLHAIDLKPGVSYRAIIEVRGNGQQIKVLLGDTAVFNTSSNEKAGKGSSANFKITLSPNMKVAFSQVSATLVGNAK